jgi:hypothetical protein
MAVDEEDLNGLSLPHLEDVAEDSYGQLNNDSWGSDAQLLHWINHSNDPTAH